MLLRAVNRAVLQQQKGCKCTDLQQCNLNIQYDEAEVGSCLLNYRD